MIQFPMQSYDPPSSTNGDTFKIPQNDGNELQYRFYNTDENKWRIILCKV